MKTHVDKSTFVNTFDEYGRSDNFTRAAREALFDYYEQLEDDLGEDIEFDCIAICCDWSEYADAQDWAKDYYTADQYDREIAENCDPDWGDIGEIHFFTDYVKDQTQVIEFDGGILVMAF